MRRAFLVAALLLAGACAHGAPGTTSFPKARVVLRQGSQRLVIQAEVAATPDLRQFGLMDRKTVPAGTGMLFVFPGPVRAGFWMKDTLVDLQILFIREGVVREIRTMRACHADPCPQTIPRVDYDQALELPLGTLGSLNVGAKAEVFGSIPSPA